MTRSKKQRDLLRDNSQYSYFQQHYNSRFGILASFLMKGLKNNSNKELEKSAPISDLDMMRRVRLKYLSAYRLKMSISNDLYF